MKVYQGILIAAILLVICIKGFARWQDQPRDQTDEPFEFISGEREFIIPAQYVIGGSNFSDPQTTFAYDNLGASIDLVFDREYLRSLGVPVAGVQDPDLSDLTDGLLITLA